MRRLQARKPEKIERLAKRLPVQYIVFDVLYYKGQDITKQPLMERKAILSEKIDEDDIIATIRYVDGCGTDLFSACSKVDLEGIVLKRKDAPYLKGKRSKAWQKVINYKEVEVVITGYRKGEFGWMIGIEEGSDIRPVGILELGVGPTERKALYDVSNLIKITEDDKFVYLEPRLKCKVKYRGWTKDSCAFQCANTSFFKPGVFPGFQLKFPVCFRSSCFLYKNIATNPTTASNIEDMENKLYTKMVDGFPASKASKTAYTKPTMPNTKLGENPIKLDWINTSSVCRS